MEGRYIIPSSGGNFALRRQTENTLEYILEFAGSPFVFFPPHGSILVNFEK